MIACLDVRKEQIRQHYDWSTLFYRLLWGRHIHHGLWDADEAPTVAQVRLIEAMLDAAGIAEGSHVLDVGCGMGGSSIHLARHRQCRVTGITLSPIQRRWARCAAWWQGVSPRTEFLCGDVESAGFPPRSFDAVWSIECTEHLFDKPRFFQRAATWLRPGGRLVVCAWLLGAVDADAVGSRRVFDVCEGFLCPSLGTANDYTSWIEGAGLRMQLVHDWTDRVTRTWEICLDRVQRSRVRWLTLLLHRHLTQFIDRFETILEAFYTGAMRYGCFVARA